MPTFNLATTVQQPELTAHLTHFEKYLAKAMYDDAFVLQAPLSRVVQAGGKRLRPALLLSIVLASGNKIDTAALNAATAVELIHLGSLVHDDLIDEADSRWSVVTISSQEGGSSAIIAGDYLFALAARQAALVDAPTGFILAETLAALCAGQARELADQHNVKRSRDAYLEAIQGKTAALFEATCQLGAKQAGMDASSIRAFAKYGKALGMAFQLMDDVLDFISSPELSGKATGTDVRQGVYTLPIILSEHKQELDASDLTSLLLQDRSIHQTIQLAQEYAQQAVQTLSKADDYHIYQGLLELPETYIRWALDNLVAQQYRTAIR